MTNILSSSQIERPSRVKLSKPQIALLSAAAERDDALVVLSGSKAGLARKPILALLQRGLLVEVASLAGQAHWRVDEDGGPISAFVTQAGLIALGRTAAPLAEDRVDRHDSEQLDARMDVSGGRQAPGEIIGQDCKDGSDQIEPAAPAHRHKPGGKRALVISLMQRPEGGTLPELVAVTGWLPHTTRAALTGLRQKGYALDRSARPDGAMAYRIVAAPSCAGHAA